jgi:ferredoxin
MQRVRRDPLRSGCTGGGCNVCRMQVLAGHYEFCKRPHQTQQHVVNMCGILPRSDMIITPVGNQPVRKQKKRKKKGFFAFLDSIFSWRRK